MNELEANKWFRHEVLSDKESYPNLYETEVKKNQYNQQRRDYFSRQNSQQYR